jgi:hypothetical protein
LFDITVRRALREVGLGAQVQQRKPFMNRKEVLARHRFSQRYENWTIDDWKRVIFSDGAKINRFNSYGRPWCWIEDGEHIGPQHVHQFVKHGGGSVMIWGCMTAFGPGAGRYFNMTMIQADEQIHARMVGFTTILVPSMACKISKFQSQ